MKSRLWNSLALRSMAYPLHFYTFVFSEASLRYLFGTFLSQERGHGAFSLSSRSLLLEVAVEVQTAQEEAKAVCVPVWLVLTP